MSSILNPVADRVVLEQLAPEQKTASGIFIPDNFKERPNEGVVIAAGPGKRDEPLTVKVGDVVIFGKHAGTKVSVNGKEYLIMRESDIFAIR